ncbi:Paramyosin, short form, partial [Eumeta japonica]
MINYDLHDARANLTELNRRLHELEIELRRLENEREELTAAYKEAEAGRKAEEQRAQRLTAELGQFRHEAERRLQEKEEEIEAIRRFFNATRPTGSPAAGLAADVLHDKSIGRCDRIGIAPVNLPNYNKWTKPPTAVYEDNYGYGINFYQPMIDYISAKEHGVDAKPPHLPWNNERGLEKYRPDRPVRVYSTEDLTRIAKDISEQAKQDLNHFEICKRTPFSVCATASAANIAKHVGVESVIVKAGKKKANREKIKAERQKKRMDEIEKELD